MGYSRQEYWSGLPFPSLGHLPDPGIEPRSPDCRQILYQLSHQGSPERIQNYEQLDHLEDSCTNTETANRENQCPYHV